MRLNLCAEGFIRSGDVDLRLILSTYNLCFWLIENGAYVYLPVDYFAVAFVKISGEYNIYSQNCDDVDRLVSILENVLGLRENTLDFYVIAHEDSLLGPFAKSYYGWRLRSTSLWWALVTGVCQQNASFKQGWRMLHNIVKVYGKRVGVGDKEILRPPTPREVLENSEKLLEAGVGYRAKTITNIARFILENKVSEDDLASASPEEAESILMEINGVGLYTARLALAFSLRRYELPPIDKWLRKIASMAYSIDEKSVEKYWISKWGKWSALAAIAVTIALDAEPLTKALTRVKNKQLLPMKNLTPTPINMIGFCNST
ncbi:hypothetical protein QPL79_06070 [Ignisphaera sp. 4213-co]|uniref:DNA-(apurinic or apyrimidinic site) lyase n=1 Tax=Ignisphaera cupida TaxID=3050454 RepID=A0ABD4Z890_9CREN|nr:hypothetical protein [Ignisphaera sp. 4213-co]MDK6028924.1 hypothetical protein [Ignisphaera sp. 4213-co]